MAAVEYVILIGFAIAGLVLVLHHHPGTVPGHRRLVHPVRGRRARQPGRRAAAGGVHLLRLGRHPVRQRGGQAPPGQPRPGRDHRRGHPHRHLRPGRHGPAGHRLTAAAPGPRHLGPGLRRHRLGGSGWGKVMALALALSVIAATGTNIVLTSRITYGMASYHTLPRLLASVSPRFRTPVPASVLDRRRAHRPDLGVPAGHLGAGRVQRRRQRLRAAVRRVLHPHRAGHRRLLPPPRRWKASATPSSWPSARWPRPGSWAGSSTAPSSRPPRPRTGPWPASSSWAWS